MDNHEDQIFWILFSFPRTFSLHELCLGLLQGAVSRQTQRKKCCTRQSPAMGGWFSDVLSGPQQNRDGVMNEWCLEHGCLAAVVSHVPPGPFVVFFNPLFLILGSSLDENPCISLYDLEGSNKKYVFIVYTRKHNPCSNPWFLSRPQMPSTPVAPWCLQRACNTAGNFCEMKRLCHTICFPYHHKKRMMHPKHPKNNLERADAFRDFFCPFACPFPRLWSAVVWRHGIAKYIFIPQRETPGVLFFSNMRP